MVAITAAGVSAAANVLGGLGGFIGGSRANKLSRAQFRESKRQFDVTRQDALNAIQNRVKDATAAGIHPLFAMGMNAPTSGNPIIAGDPNAGSDAIGSAARGIARAAAVAEEAAIRKATIKSIEARTAADEAEAMYIRSKTAEVMHSIAATRAGRDFGGVNPDGTITTPVPVPPKKAPGIQAGTQPAMVDVELQDGTRRRIINPNVAEAGEFVGPMLMAEGWWGSHTNRVADTLRLPRSTFRIGSRRYGNPRHKRNTRPRHGGYTKRPRPRTTRYGRRYM